MKRYQIIIGTFIFLWLLFAGFAIGGSNHPAKAWESNRHQTQFHTITVNDLDIFYREAGSRNAPTIVLLHGFPTSSHMFRNLIPALADDFHLVAPDYPGFGNSSMPDVNAFDYTFDRLADVMEAFLEKLNLRRYSLYVMDYGAPIGFRIAMAHPERITGFINQNGNAYKEGLGEAWAGLEKYWQDKNEANEAALLPSFSLEGLKWQYTHGTRNPENINPDSWKLGYVGMLRPNAHRVNLDLFYDYQNNVKLYSKWQQYLRDNQPPMLIVWGKNDAFFPESGAAAFKKDLNNVDYYIYDTGHFALDEDGDDILLRIRNFMSKIN